MSAQRRAEKTVRIPETLLRRIEGAKKYRTMANYEVIDEAMDVYEEKKGT